MWYLNALEIRLDVHIRARFFFKKVSPLDSYHFTSGGGYPVNFTGILTCSPNFVSTIDSILSRLMKGFSEIN